MGGFFFGIGADQTGGPEEQFQLAPSPENVEIAGKDHRTIHLADEFIEPLQLVLTIAVGQGEMHQEDGQLLGADLNHQPFHPLIEVVEPVTDDWHSGQDCIALGL